MKFKNDSKNYVQDIFFSSQPYLVFRESMYVLTLE
jgi:hypothetical protein